MDVTQVLAMIGETLDDDVTGAVISRRKPGDKIAIWNRDKNNKEVVLRIGFVVAHSKFRNKQTTSKHLRFFDRNVFTFSESNNSLFSNKKQQPSTQQEAA